MGVLFFGFMVTRFTRPINTRSPRVLLATLTKPRVTLDILV